MSIFPKTMMERTTTTRRTRSTRTATPSPSPRARRTPTVKRTTMTKRAKVKAEMMMTTMMKREVPTLTLERGALKTTGTLILPSDRNE
jgi:5-formyltetrahydrofolate cyclo-ligase